MVFENPNGVIFAGGGWQLFYISAMVILLFTLCSFVTIVSVRPGSFWTDARSFEMGHFYRSTSLCSL